jgi:aminomethyltransferase
MQKERTNSKDTKNGWDTLRQECGLCLYGHKLNEDICLVEAQLAWTIEKRRIQEGGLV